MAACGIAVLAQLNGQGARKRHLHDTYQVLDPFVRDGLPEVQVFLLVIKGMHKLVGKKKKRYKHTGQSFYLVSAIGKGKTWVLPLSEHVLLSW